MKVDIQLLKNTVGNKGYEWNNELNIVRIKTEAYHYLNIKKVKL